MFENIITVMTLCGTDIMFSIYSLHIINISIMSKIMFEIVLCQSLFSLCVKSCETFHQLTLNYCTAMVNWICRPWIFCGHLCWFSCRAGVYYIYFKVVIYHAVVVYHQALIECHDWYFSNLSHTIRNYQFCVFENDPPLFLFVMS